MRFRLAVLVLFITPTGWAASRGACQPAPEIRAELQRAAAVPIADAMAFDRNIAPFLALRQRHPANLFVDQRYQDAVQQYGIEGHLRALTEEYQALSAEHPGDVKYSYLSARTLIGRSTPAAIAAMTEILAEEPDFAPAHRSLAEIYGSEAFRDPAKERVESEKFLALCPGSALAHLPGALPAPSKLIDQAEQLLTDHADPDRVAAMAIQGIRDDEWRLQRIRPFDWYSTDFKRQVQQDLQHQYWRAWSIQVRCYRKAGKPEKAAAQLQLMEQRAERLDRATPVYWDAQMALVRLYVEGKQMPQAAQRLGLLNNFLKEHPDPDRAAQVADLEKLVASPNH